MFDYATSLSKSNATVDLVKDGAELLEILVKNATNLTNVRPSFPY